jgi:hypothetical protein
MPNDNILKLRQADQARTDFAMIESHLGRRSGLAASTQAKDRPKKPDDHQNGAQPQLYLRLRCRMALGSPINSRIGMTVTSGSSIGASHWCVPAAAAGRRYCHLYRGSQFAASGDPRYTS